MDRAPPRGAPRDAVGQRWLAVFAFQAALSAAASALRLAVFPRGRSHPLLGVPTGLLLALDPFLSCAATGLLALALLLTESPHPRPPPLPRSALATALLAAAGTLCVGAAAAMLPEDAGWEAVAWLGFRGAVLGSIFAGHYFGRRRWLLQFPVLQRPLFYGLKMGLLPSGNRALKLSIQAFLISHFLVFFLPWQFRKGGSVILTEISILMVTAAVSFCLEINYQFVQVVHTRRCSFAPPQSTAAAETNPTEFILETLEQSDSRSLIQYLAYQDLCVVSECNVEPWRRAAFFEESGETYKRIVTACLKPLEEFTSKIAEALEGLSSDKPELMLQQSKLFSAFDDSQICTWCARTLAVLTARSRQEDRYGVAQLTGCNAAVMTTLLSALVAIETCLGKKTNPQPVHSLGPENIRWASLSTGRKGTGVSIASTQKGGLHKKAYTMADVLRTSVYQIVSAFIDDLRANAKPSSLEKNWISEGRKPVYGSQAVLVQKLILFIEYRAV
ncbi:hypothetical protein BDA96_04G298100 [Sorghum bicolor]|uniref:Nucleoporin protein Ndc1-Nup n=2 Tax=Sorghum bicolor TaxID=4558 RepID=A0A921UJQ5_SORBI|nr:uncharacterized protein LOC8076023 [Sorghum bicolor]EES07443.1 hypothetical protein SORBI_3004G279800 [Sorghum bicolor]KAG0534657.1 hypothetical protein BDA96_04G298100 [Sorghum bicolor]|eukprot:XP_002454467.1 uncharacterized protein LOC8076023 [Sorghum bicolor]